MNGLKSSTAQNIKASGCELFHRIFECNDLVCFSETWRDPNENFALDFNDEFIEFHEPGYRNHLGGRASGGMSLLVKKSVAKSFSIVLSDSYHFWCKLNKKSFG